MSQFENGKSYKFTAPTDDYSPTKCVVYDYFEEATVEPTNWELTINWRLGYYVWAVCSSSWYASDQVALVAENWMDSNGSDLGSYEDSLYAYDRSLIINPEVYFSGSQVEGSGELTAYAGASTSTPVLSIESISSADVLVNGTMYEGTLYGNNGCLVSRALKTVTYTSSTLSHFSYISGEMDLQMSVDRSSMWDPAYITRYDYSNISSETLAVYEFSLSDLFGTPTYNISKGGYLNGLPSISIVSTTQEDTTLKRTIDVNLGEICYVAYGDFISVS